MKTIRLLGVKILIGFVLVTVPLSIHKELISDAAYREREAYLDGVFDGRRDTKQQLKSAQS